MVEPDSSLMSV